MARFPNGDLAVLLSIHGTVDADPGPAYLPVTASSSANDGLIVKLSETGSLLWARHLGGGGGILANALAVDTDGAVLVTGAFNGTVDFDPGPSEYLLNSAGSYDIFVCRLDAAGDLDWAFRIGGASSDVAYSVSCGSGGSIYLTGGFAGSVDFDPGPGTFTFPVPSIRDGYLLKLSGEGGFVWAIRLADAGDGRGVGVSVTSDGGIVWAGCCDGLATAEPEAVSLAPLGDLDIFVMRYEEDGDFTWARRLGGPQRDVPWSMCVTSDSSVIVTGQFAGTADFDPGIGVASLTTEGTGPMQTDAFVFKLDAAGAFKWARSVGGPDAEVGYGVATNASGHAWVTGTFAGVANLDDWTSDKALTSSGNSDFFLLRLDSDGAPLSLAGAGGALQDLVRAVNVTDDGRAYLGGFFWEQADVLPGPGFYELRTSGANDGFLLALEPALKVELTSTTRDPTSDPEIPITATFTAPVSGFSLEDIVVTNGTASGLSGDGAVYTFTVSPASSGIVTVRIRSLSVRDASGDGNAASTPFVRYFDSALPITHIRSEAPAAVRYGSIGVEVTFDERVVDFGIPKLKLRNCTASEFAGDGLHFTFKLAPILEGEFQVDVVSGAAHDEAGNPCTAASLQRIYDVTPPTIAIGAPSTTVTAKGPVTFEVTFGGAETIELPPNRVLLLKTGTASGLVDVAGTGVSRTITVSSIEGDGSLAIAIDAGAAADAAGNVTGRTESSALVSIDNTPPAIAVSGPVPAVTAVGPVRFTVSYAGAEAITLRTEDVALASTGTATGKVSVSGSGVERRTVQIDSVDGEGTLTVAICESTAYDAAGNRAPGAGPSAPVKVSAEAVAQVPVGYTPTIVLALLGIGMLATRRLATAGKISPNDDHARGNPGRQL